MDAPRETYRRMSLAGKQAAHRDRMREPAMACPRCEAQIVVADSLRHAEICPGRREPHPLSRWLTWSEVRSLGVPKSTIHRWIERGRIHVRGGARERRFLERDVKRWILATRAGSDRGTR